METPTGSVRRRTLRPLNPTTLMEGVLTRWGPSDDVIVQIHGGPPHKTAVVAVGDTIRRAIRLNGCGAGSTRLVGIVGGACVEIAVDNQVLLAGRLAAARSVAGDQP